MEKASSFRDTNMVEDNDPFSFILDGSEISHSQEELLRHQPFFGKNVNQPSPPSTTSDADLIIMMSMPQTQPIGKDSSAPKDQDVFLTPLEKSLSLHISDDDPFDNMPQSIDWCDDSQATMNVDLGRDSDLRFSNVLLTQEMQEEFIERRNLGIQSQKGKEKLGSEAETPSCNVEKCYEKHDVFDILKTLVENRKDDDDGVEHLTLLEECKKRGLSFPRPRWWLENGDSFKSGE